MLYLHETHRVAGERAEDFERLWRTHAESLSSTDDMRVLWYLHQAHGTGPSYTVVTITALRDGATWERLARALEDGVPGAWAREADSMRHAHASKILAPVEWSELQEVDLGSVGGPSDDRLQTLYMEDTVLPHPGRLAAYLDAAGTLYARGTIAKRVADGTSLLELIAAFRTLAGPNAGREVVLWQRVVRPELLERLLTKEVPPEHRGPGSWMQEALAFRDTWESRLLRTAPWSPLD